MKFRGLFNKKGVTLLELIIVLALVGIVTAGAFSLLFFGNVTFSRGSDQYDIQSQTRLVADYIIDEVRFATDLGIISAQEAADGIEASKNGDNDFSYFYLENGDMIHYDSVGDSERVIRGYLTEDSEFRKQDSSTLGISLESLYRNQEYLVDTEVGLVNYEISGNDIAGTTGTGIRYSHDRSFMSDAGNGGGNGENGNGNDDNGDNGNGDNDNGNGDNDEEEPSDPVITEGIDPASDRDTLILDYDQEIVSATLSGATTTSVNISGSEVTFNLSGVSNGTTVFVDVVGATGGTSTYSVHFRNPGHGWINLTKV